MKLKQILSAALIASAAVAAAGAASAADVASDGERAALKATIDTCATCHGVKGHSVSPTFPNLAAQSSAYIQLQLKAFKDQSRGDPDAQAYMWGMAAQLSDDMIKQLGDYYAAQPPAPGRTGSSTLIAQGKKLFAEGVPDKGIPACASCHGANAEGLAVFPRLAGQHAPYLLKQLLVIQNVLRTAPVMHGVVKDLTKDQMQSVVAYLESI
jgi:cytochrome c553